MAYSNMSQIQQIVAKGRSTQNASPELDNNFSNTSGGLNNSMVKDAIIPEGPEIHMSTARLTAAQSIASKQNSSICANCNTAGMNSP